MSESQIFANFRVGQNTIDRDACLHMLLGNVWTRNVLTSVEFPVQPGINMCVDFMISSSLKSIDVKRKEYKSFMGGLEAISTNLPMAVEALKNLETTFYESMFGAS
jgi:hypothetical protein